jgi:hypothetical protein
MLFQLWLLMLLPELLLLLFFAPLATCSTRYREGGQEAEKEKATLDQPCHWPKNDTCHADAFAVAAVVSVLWPSNV